MFMESEMKFVKDQSSDESLDLVCRMCPMHLLEPGDKLKCIPDWCNKCGHEFLGLEEDEDCYKLYIKKKK